MRGVHQLTWVSCQQLLTPVYNPVSALRQPTSSRQSVRGASRLTGLFWVNWACAQHKCWHYKRNKYHKAFAESDMGQLNMKYWGNLCEVWLHIKSLVLSFPEWHEARPGSMQVPTYFTLYHNQQRPVTNHNHKLQISGWQPLAPLALSPGPCG